MADPDDATRREDDLNALARQHGVAPAFRWPDDDDEELEGCFLRLRRDDTEAHGLITLEIGALDGSWTDHFLVRAEHFEAAAAGPVQFHPSTDEDLTR